MYDPIFNKAVMETQWFEDTEFNLYIPHPWADDWITSGRDLKIERTLDRYWLENGENKDGLAYVPEEVFKPLGLIEVDQALKRWSEVDGFYHA